MEEWEELWKPVDATDDRVRRGTARLAARRAAVLAGGARHLGWKVGWNNLDARRALGVHSGVVGFLSTGSVSRDSAVGLTGTRGAAVEVELALRVNQVHDDRLRIAAIAPAIEVLDVPNFDVEDGIASNVWHYAAVVGAERPYEDGMLDRLQIAVRGASGPLRCLDEPSATLGPLDKLLAFVAGGARLLGGELTGGDVVLSGNLTRRPRPVAVGDVIEVDFGLLGALAVRFIP